MPDSKNAYAVVIADLERKRAEIDAMIAHLKSMAGLNSGSNSDGPAQLNSSDEETSSSTKNPLLGMKVVEAAKVVLRENRAPMSPADITTALEKGGLPVSSSKTVASVLHRRSKDVGDIVSPKRGAWGLKEWYPGRSFGNKDTDRGDEVTSTSEPEPLGVPTPLFPRGSSD